MAFTGFLFLQTAEKKVGFLSKTKNKTSDCLLYTRITARTIAEISVMVIWLLPVENMKHLWEHIQFCDQLAPLVHHKWHQRQQIVPERAYRQYGNKMFPCCCPIPAEKRINPDNSAFYLLFLYTCTVAVTRLIMAHTIFQTFP